MVLDPRGEEVGGNRMICERSEGHTSEAQLKAVSWGGQALVGMCLKLRKSVGMSG